MDGNLAFNVAQLPSLREMLETVSGRKICMPTRYKLMSTMESHFKKVKSNLIELIKKQKYICVTADVWSSRAQSYLGVTVHFLNEYKRESHLLAFREIKKRQTYDVLAKPLDDIFSDFSIEKSKITNIVTDGGSNFCKIFKKYGDSIDATVIETDRDELPFEENENSDESVENDNENHTQIMHDEYGEQFVNEVITFDEVVPGTYDERSSEADMNSYFESHADQSSEVEPYITTTPPQRRCVSHYINNMSLTKIWTALQEPHAIKHLMRYIRYGR